MRPWKASGRLRPRTTPQTNLAFTRSVITSAKSITPILTYGHRHSDEVTDADAHNFDRAAANSELDFSTAEQSTHHRTQTRITSEYETSQPNQPYSIPEPDKWRGIARWRMMHQFQGKIEQGESTWLANSTTRPLLLAFDAFDTLFTPREPVSKQYCDVARQWGFELDEYAVMASFNKAFKSFSSTHPNYGRETGMHPEQWWCQIIEQTLEPLLSAGKIPSEAVSELYHRFSSCEGYKLFPDVMPFLSDIGTSFQSAKWPPKRTMLGIISNSDPRVRSILESFGIGIRPSLFPPRYSPNSADPPRDFGPAHFAFATLSYETGVAKPSMGIFHDAVQDAQQALGLLDRVARLTRTGTELLDNVHTQFHHMYIGDELEKDIIPALKCGWDAVLLDRSTREPVSLRTVDERKITVINSLQSLKMLVGADRLENPVVQAPVWLDQQRPIEMNPALAPRPISGVEHGRKDRKLGRIVVKRSSTEAEESSFSSLK